MEWFITIAFGILGIIIGSFLNVVILRMGTGKTVGGRSMCFSCGHQLAWYELVPLLSFIIQRGKCNHCKSKISWQYFWVELATGLLFASVAYQFFGSIELIFWLIIVTFGMVITGYDIKHHMIPWKPMIGLLIVGLFLKSSLLGLLLVPLPFLIIWLVSKGKALGFGDIEIMGGMGLILGVSAGFSAVILAFWIATVGVVLWVIVTRQSLKSLRKKPIPFGPFLLLGLYLVGVWHIDIVKYIMTMV